MACLNCCDDTACCIYSFFYPIPGVRYPLIKTVGVPSIGQCLSIPRGACANGFMVPDSPYVWQGTPKNINCDRAACNDPPCLCCCSGQCFEVPCDDLTACTSVGGVVVESCEGCEEYDESLRGACCSQECDGFHCRRMTECECLSGESAAGRRYTHFAGPGTECEEVSRCCIGGTVNQAIDTEEACTVAGGDWVTGHACDEYPCGSPPCNCFCDEEHPCPSECACVNGQCVPAIDKCCHVSFQWFPAVYDPDTNTFPGLPDFDTWVGIPNALIPGWTCSWSFGGSCSKYVPVSSEEECAAQYGQPIPELPFDIDPGWGGGAVGAYFSNTPCGACCDRFGCYEQFQGGYCAGTFYPYAKCEDEPCNPLP